MRAFVLSTFLALSAALPATAQEPSPTPFKFTTGLYHLSGGGLPSEWTLDLNLRYTSSWGNAWVGWFRAPHEDMQQARAGWDRTFTLGVLQVQPSLQIASGGFRGGSLYAEAGDDWYLGAGLGRTNLRPYVNLNFDPNDAWTLAAGRRWADHQSLGLLLVGDNRQNPDQRHLHLVWRKPLAGDQRLTLDLLAKRGLVDGTLVRRLGATVGYDWAHHFVRLAWDPKVNFSPQDMLRLSGGLRF
ncbi:MAG: hypothetical protein JWQ76_1629 [Ramlibacter sp.]|nr:hypothetical protein [Ramlibacter sp.]